MKDLCTVVPDGVLKVYFCHVQIGDLDGTYNLTKNEQLQSVASQPATHASITTETAVRTLVAPSACKACVTGRGQNKHCNTQEPTQRLTLQKRTTRSSAEAMPLARLVVYS